MRVGQVIAELERAMSSGVVEREKVASPTDLYTCVDNVLSRALKIVDRVAADYEREIQRT